MPHQKIFVKQISNVTSSRTQVFGSTNQTPINDILYTLRWYDFLLSTIGISINGTRSQALGFKIYGSIYSAILWLNACRCLSLFQAGETFNAYLLLKVVAVFWYFLAAVQHSATLHATRGTLCYITLWDVWKDTIDMCDLSRTLKKFSKPAFFVAFVLVAGNCVSLSVLMYTTDTLDIILAPYTIYVTYLPPSEDIVFRMFALCLHFMATAAWIYPVGIVVLLLLTLHRGFTKVNTTLIKALDEDKYIQNKIDDYRLQHQHLCDTTHFTDRVFRAVAGFCLSFNSLNIIIFLFTMIYLDRNSVFYQIVLGFWLLVSFGLVFGLCGSAALLNFQAHFTRHALYRVELDRYGEKERCSYLTFLSRVEGTYVGQSVFGLFVINTTSILTLLTVLLSYFAFTVTLSNVASSNVYTCSCSAVNVNGTFSCLLQSSS